MMKAKTDNNNNMLDIIHSCITKLYSREAADAFMTNPEFKNSEQLDNITQRGLANRVLISKLLIFRSTNDVSVTEVIYCLVPDGDNESWMSVFKLVILPFLKANNVKI